MSTSDLVSRHYSLRTRHTVVHPSINTPSIHSTWFTDGDGVRWLFLNYQSTVRGVEGGKEEENGDQAMLNLVERHCASAKWSINLQLDIPDGNDGVKPAPEPATDAGTDRTQMLQRILAVTGPNALVDKLESMVLDPNIPPGSAGGGDMALDNPAAAATPEGWGIQDGRHWFGRTFPSLRTLVNYEEVWVLVKRSQNNEGVGFDEVGEDEDVMGGYITTLADYNPQVANDNGETTHGARGRVYISSLLVYPTHRRKGLGRALLRHVIARAKSSIYRPLVCLTVICENAGARGMYLVDGFGVEGNIWVIRSPELVSG